MAQLKIEVDAGEAGFAADRLERIDRHFAKYVDDGRLPGWLIAVARGGKVVHLSSYGKRDLESGAPVENDSLWRIYSMTKPITSVAAMMLYEEGAFELKDPIHRWIPSFKEARVYKEGSALKPVTRPMSEPIRIWHLLTHTSGLTYGFHHAHPVDTMYRNAGYEWGSPRGKDLAAVSTTGPACRSCSNPALSGTTACRPTCSVASSRSPLGCRSTSSSAPASSSRWA